MDVFRFVEFDSNLHQNVFIDGYFLKIFYQKRFVVLFAHPKVIFNIPRNIYRSYRPYTWCIGPLCRPRIKVYDGVRIEN